MLLSAMHNIFGMKFIRKSDVFHIEESVLTYRMQALKMTFNKMRHFNWELTENAELYGQFDMPILRPVREAAIGKLIPFNEASRCRNPQECLVHFYIDDYRFERVWNNYMKYLPMLRRFKGVITPDFSMYLDMPLPQQIENCWRNRCLAYWLQEQGINVLLSVGWSDAESLKWAFDGIPENSVLSVTTQGCLRDHLCMQAFLNGMHELVRRKHPLKIIVYGRFPTIWKERFSVEIEIHPCYSEEKWCA